MTDQNQPTLKPEQLAHALTEFLGWASVDERFRFCSELKSIASNGCPQGALASVAFLSEAVAWIAKGGELKGDELWEDAEQRMLDAPRSRPSDHRPDGDDDYEEAKHDRDNARALTRLLTKHSKRAEAIFTDISQQVPIE